MPSFQHLRFAFRSLRGSPAITLTALITLALGIGVNTTVFSVVDAVLLQSLRYPHPERIVELGRHYPNFDGGWAVTSTNFDFWRSQSHSFAAVAATDYFPTGVNFVGKGEPERLTALGVSADFAGVFGAQPMLGRFFTEAEDKPGAGHSVVLSNGLWSSLFGKDANILGRSLALGGASYTVVGVMPPGFQAEQPVDAWIPLQLAIDSADRANNYRVLARLKPGVSMGEARQDLSLVRNRFARQYGTGLIGANESISLIRYQDWLVRGIRPALLVLMGAVGFVLLIACGNVGNLLLARSTGRRQEMAIRVALGSSTWQIVRQLLIESILLSFTGAIAGVALASFALPAVLAFAPADLAGSWNIHLDWRVLLFTAALSLATGIVFGLFPALQGAKVGIHTPLREAGTRTTSNAAANWVRKSLVVAEIAISLVLLAGAGLLIETFSKLNGINPGFDPSQVLTMQMSISDRKLSNTAAVVQLLERVISRLEATPGIADVAATNTLPLQIGTDLPFSIAGRKMRPEDLPDEDIRYVTPDYFRALRIPVLAGRQVLRTDSQKAAGVAVVNEAFARKYFPKSSALGETITVGVRMGPAFADRPRQIVGVVASTRVEHLAQPSTPVIYLPYSQVPDAEMAVWAKMVPLRWVVRTDGDPLGMAERVRRETLTASGGIPMAAPQRLTEIVGDSISQQRFVMGLLGVFAALAVLLGAVGIYGVISYGVAQRTRELGIRSALGANRSDLLGLVIGQGMKMTAAGLTAGLAATWALTRFLQGMLYGVSPMEPAVLAAVTGLLGIIALAACLIPARKASRIDPAIALREG